MIQIIPVGIIIIILCFVIGVLSTTADVISRLFRCLFVNFTLSRRSVNVSHFLIVISNVIILQLSKPYLPRALSHFGLKLKPLVQCLMDRHCLSHQLDYRICASLTVLFGLLSILMCCGKHIAYASHTSAIVAKVVACPLLFIYFLFVPNNYFDIYARVATYASVLFLLLQTVSLLDFVYTWNEAWVANADDTGSTWWFVYIVMCGGMMTIASGISAVIIYINLPNVMCKWILVAACFACVTLGAISITDYVPHGALLPSSAVFTFVVFQLWSAFKSDPNNNITEVVLNGRSYLIISISFIVLLYNCISVTAFPDVFHISKLHNTQGNSTGTILEEYRDIDPLVTQRSNPQSFDTDVVQLGGLPFGINVFQLKMFHFMFMIFSFYLAMTLTNWRATIDPKKLPLECLWVQIVASCSTIVLYGWSLAAPALFPNREF